MLERGWLGERPSRRSPRRWGACSPWRSRASTKRSPSRPSTPRRWRCARSRCSSTSSASPGPRSAGGLLYVERLTDELEAEARRLIEHIDDLGGAVAAIESGFYQQLIGDEAYERECRIAAGEEVVVGVNRYADGRPPARAVRRAARPGLASAHGGWRPCGPSATRARSTRRSPRLLEVARGSENSMPAMIAAVDAEATLGEICGTLRQVFGDYRPAVAAQI